MKKLIWIGFFIASPSYAGLDWPERMPVECAIQLLDHADIRDGSYKSEPDDIVAGLKDDWYAHPGQPTAKFDECDDVGFYYVIVDKKSCGVTKSDFGVSHGICD